MVDWMMQQKIKLTTNIQFNQEIRMENNRNKQNYSDIVYGQGITQFANRTEWEHGAAHTYFTYITNCVNNHTYDLRPI